MMKSFTSHYVRNVLAVLVVGTLFIVGYSTNQGFLKAPITKASTTDNVSGWAWSENIGWLNFNSVSELSGESYGVSVSTASKSTGGTDNFSGHAWSENIGWVSFGDNGCPSGQTVPCRSRISWTTGKVSGWARACAGSINGDCTGIDRTDGWDGWIKLSDDANVNGWAGKGVTILANKFGGWAWGSDVVGWIDFAPKIGGISVGPVIGVPPCIAVDVPVGSWGICQPFASSVCTAPPATQLFVDGGIQIGACPVGGTTTRTCDVTVTCSVTPPISTAGICSPANLSACKPVFKAK